jgi:hypothetical protein
MKKLLFLCCLVGSMTIAQSQSSAQTRLPGAASSAPNDCLPAAMRVYHELPGPPTCLWKRILSARYSDGRMHHVYCVFSLGSQVYAYDNSFGSRRVFPKDKSSAAVVRAVDFQATYGIYLDQSEKPKLVASSRTFQPDPSLKRGEGRSPVTRAAEAKRRTSSDD